MISCSRACAAQYRVPESTSIGHDVHAQRRFVVVCLPSLCRLSDDVFVVVALLSSCSWALDCGEAGQVLKGENFSCHERYGEQSPKECNRGHDSD